MTVFRRRHVKVRNVLPVLEKPLAVVVSTRTVMMVMTVHSTPASAVPASTTLDPTARHVTTDFSVQAQTLVLTVIVRFIKEVLAPT